MQGYLATHRYVWLIKFNHFVVKKLKPTPKLRLAPAQTKSQFQKHPNKLARSP
jgi:hypothetical protein